MRSPSTPIDGSHPVLEEEMRQQGSVARGAGQDRTDCPYDGLCARWWLQGYDSAPDMMKAFASGVPLGRS